MLSKNTIKKTLFVIVLTSISIGFAGCGIVSSNSIEDSTPIPKNREQKWGKANIAGALSSSEINESSGIAASRCNKGVFWTHNDSDGGEFIYAINETGEKLGTWIVSNAKNNDWEDIAAFKDKSGKCFVYLGDIGNNSRRQNEFKIYKIAEPQIEKADKSSSKTKPRITAPAEAIAFKYQQGATDAETLLVHPQTGQIYVITKQPIGPADVYKIGAKTEKIGNLSVPEVPNGFLTGGDISPDGKHLIISDYVGGYEFNLPEGSTNFDDIFKEKPVEIDLGVRKQGEGICYSIDGRSIFATSEGANSPLIRVDKN